MGTEGCACALRGGTAVQSHCWLRAIQTRVFLATCIRLPLPLGCPVPGTAPGSLGRREAAARHGKTHRISHVVHEAGDGDIHHPPWRKPDFIPLSCARENQFPQQQMGLQFCKKTEREKKHGQPRRHLCLALKCNQAGTGAGQEEQGHLWSTVA